MPFPEVVNLNAAVQVADPGVAAVDEVVDGLPRAEGVVDGDSVVFQRREGVVQHDQRNGQIKERRDVLRVHLGRE